MAVIDFNDGTFSTLATTFSFTFTDSGAPGITFTVSGADTGGNSPVAVDLNLLTTGGLNFTNGTDTQADNFTLAMTGGNVFAGNLIIDAGNVNGTWQVKLDGVTVGTLNSTNTIFSTAIVGDVSAITFTSSATTFDLLNIESITADIVCFLEGTLIATPEGPVAVETLQPGDAVLTADGGMTRVNWLGVQPVDTTSKHPTAFNPIRIQAGALGNGLPERDLFVSPDHGIELDGILANAAALVNGRTISQVRTMPGKAFTYYHIETGAHELLLAEGVAAESYQETGGLAHFSNADALESAPRPEMTLPRVTTSRLLPDRIRARLAAVADELQRRVA